MSWWRRFRAWVTAPGPRRWRGVILVVPFFLMLGIAVGYTNYVQRESDQRWCDLIILLNRSGEQNPPETEQEREFRAILRELQENLHC